MLLSVLMVYNLIYNKIEPFSMYEQASSKNQKFRIEIRRRQRQQLMKKQRDLFLAQQKKLSGKQSRNMAASIAGIKIVNKNVNEVYELFLKTNSFVSEISVEDLVYVLGLLLDKGNLEVPESVFMLATTILYLGSVNSNSQQKKGLIRKALAQANIQQTIFQLIVKKTNQLQEKLVKLYLHVIKSMSLVKMQKIKDPRLLQKYLLFIIDNLISEPSVIIFLAYISESFVFPPQVIRTICTQASRKEKIVKILIISILTNYIILEKNDKYIYELFDQIVQTFIHLYIQSKAYQQKYAHSCLNAMMEFIEKFPENMGNQLLRKVETTKLQETMIVILTVSNEKTKQLVFELEQTIIDKCISDRGCDFFNKFSKEIIEQIMLGIQYTNLTIIERCLKIATKLFYYASPEYIKQITSGQELHYVLQDLAYNKNEFISETAIQLQKYLPQESTTQMNDF